MRFWWYRDQGNIIGWPNVLFLRPICFYKFMKMCVFFSRYSENMVTLEYHDNNDCNWTCIRKYILIKTVALSDVLCSTIKKKKKQEAGGKVPFPEQQSQHLQRWQRERNKLPHREREGSDHDRRCLLPDPGSKPGKDRGRQLGLFDFSLNLFSLVCFNHAQPKTTELNWKGQLNTWVSHCFEWNVSKKNKLHMADPAMNTEKLSQWNLNNILLKKYIFVQRGALSIISGVGFSWGTSGLPGGRLRGSSSEGNHTD